MRAERLVRKAMARAPKATEPGPKTTKPGLKTTEFWLNFVVIVGTLVLLGLDKISPDDVAKLSAMYIGGGFYTAARAYNKK